MPRDAYMLSHPYSAEIKLGINIYFFFYSTHNRTQPLPPTDEEVPVLKNLQSKIRCNTISEGNSREEWGLQEQSQATAHLGDTCISVVQLKKKKFILYRHRLPSVMGIMEEISEHRKGWLKDGGHSQVKEGLPVSWAHSSRCVPWLICQRHHQICQLCQSTRISSIVTSQTRWLVRSQWARLKALIT